MLNRLGIFDLFSYTLPGGIYLSASITALTLCPIAPAIPTLKLDASVLVILVSCRWIVQVVLLLEQTQGFVLLKQRSVVERSAL